jgi:uncharacterized protein (DUF427 family)
VSASSGPGYRAHPDHRVTTTPARGRLRVTFTARSSPTRPQRSALDESGYPAVYYVPRTDVDMERLARTAHSTYCPFKGDASYFTLSSRKGRVITNAVWSYEAPYDEVMSIREHLAFYPDKVGSIAFTAEREGDAAFVTAPRP